MGGWMDRWMDEWMDGQTIKRETKARTRAVMGALGLLGMAAGAVYTVWGRNCIKTPDTGPGVKGWVTGSWGRRETGWRGSQGRKLGRGTHGLTICHEPGSHFIETRDGAVKVAGTHSFGVFWLQHKLFVGAAFFRSPA